MADGERTNPAALMLMVATLCLAAFVGYNLTAPDGFFDDGAKPAAQHAEPAPEPIAERVRATQLFALSKTHPMRAKQLATNAIVVGKVTGIGEEAYELDGVVAVGFLASALERAATYGARAEVAVKCSRYQRYDHRIELDWCVFP